MIAAALLVFLAAAAPGDNRCVLCHPDVRVQFERSVHRTESVQCTACHGGDASAVSVAAAHRGNYVGVPKRRDIPALCASCHSDVARMRGYNLPVDQLALYATSRHGQQLAKGDEQVAVCTDCHGSHEILAPEDPRSSVFLRNLPRTCARCHSDAALRAKHGLKDDPFADYAASVHGKALLEQGNLSAPGCARCHGAHGASPPGVGDIDKVCGQCHGTTRTYFLEGPHKKAMDDAGLPECVSCHENHRIVPAGIERLDSVCLRCHAKASAPAEVAAKMKTLYGAADEEMGKANRLVDQAAAIPLYVEDYRARLEEARSSLLESLPVMHALNVARVETLTGRARSISHEVESELNGKIEGRMWRRVGLMVFWFYLLLTVAILVRFRNAPRREAPR